jgi:hypothetical protein
MKFFKAMDQARLAFRQLAAKLQRINAPKFKDCVFIGPQTRRTLADEQINRSLGYIDRRAWNYLRQTTLCEITRPTITTNLWKAYFILSKTGVHCVLKGPFSELLPGYFFVRLWDTEQ